MRNSGPLPSGIRSNTVQGWIVKSSNSCKRACNVSWIYPGPNDNGKECRTNCLSKRGLGLQQALKYIFVVYPKAKREDGCYGNNVTYQIIILYPKDYKGHIK